MKLTIEFDFKTVLRWVLAALLVLAALSKIANPAEFQGNLAAYKLVPAGSVLRFAAVVLPWLELLVGVFLVAGGMRRAALVWAAVLFAMFVLATGQAWARGFEINCGCFRLDFLGLSSGKGMGKFIESVSFAFFRALLLLAGAVYLLRNKKRSVIN
jgi:uncharacterized membrane protein YphA (DoxX/SURF4 family)